MTPYVSWMALGMMGIVHYRICIIHMDIMIFGAL